LFKKEMLLKIISAAFQLSIELTNFTYSLPSS
jgi:hypothetical protein